jgi:hypothetical protein
LENKGGAMRETCIFCVSKHISQAIVLVAESAKGYPFHIWLAVGHLAEAEDECISEFCGLSEKIRKIRLALMGQKGKFEHKSLMNLLIYVRRLAETFNKVKEEDRISNILHCAN